MSVYSFIVPTSIREYVPSIGRRYAVDSGDKRTFHFTYSGALRAQKASRGQIESLVDGSIIGDYDDDGVLISG